uniref:Uncharacterized protein n=1 Tax=Panagrolaimus sp. JU765 TaxID=591449 RepID=A0AC34Q5N9_9BILA
MKKALEFYEQAVLVDPTNNVLYANRSAIYLKLGETQKAIEEASHSIQLDPDWPKAYFRKGEALKEAKEYEKAIISYCQAIQFNNENEKFLNALIVCAKKSIITEFFNDAYKQMQELSLECSPFVVLSVIGQAFLIYENYDIAIQILKIALNIGSPSLKLKESTLGSLAKAYYEAGNLNKAIDYLELQLELVIELNDINSQIEIHDNIAKISTMQNDFDLALLHRDNQILLAERMGWSSYNFKRQRGELLEKMDNSQEALKCYEEMVKADTYNYDVNMKIGSLLMKKNLIDLALKAFEKANEGAKDKNSKLMALVRVGQCKLMLGDDEGLVEILNENLSSDNAEILGNILGMLCRSAESAGNVFNLYKMAKRQLKVGIESKNDAIQAEALYHLAVFYQLIENKETSKRLLNLSLKKIGEQNVSSTKQHIFMLSKLAKLEFESKNWANAIQITKQRLDLAPENEIEVQALAHADLIALYQETGEKEKRLEHLQKLENLQKKDANVSWIYETEYANYLMDDFQWMEAKYWLEQALVTVQETDNYEYESRLCKMLGIVHSKMLLHQEALVYLNQFLMIAQQQKNYSSMMDAHELLANSYFEMESWENASEHARCLSTLSNIFDKPNKKLRSFIILGKVFEIQGKTQIALKITLKARNLAEFLDLKEELAVCFGLLGKIYLHRGQYQKAMSNFCQQMKNFSFIEDPKIKCESLNYLIQEKADKNDTLWLAKLVKMQQNIAKSGDPNLQITVYRDSAQIQNQLGLVFDAICSLEHALMLSIEYEHNDTVKILLELCDFYRSAKCHLRAIKTLTNFVKIQNELCGPAIYYNLGVFYLKTGKFVQSLDTLKNCQDFDKVDNRFMYVLAIAYFKLTKPQKTLEWLNNFELSTTDAELRKKIQWDKCLVENCCKKTWETRFKVDNLLKQTFDFDVSIYLDELDLYDELNSSLLPQKAKIHQALYRRNYFLAAQLLASVAGKNQLIFEQTITDYFLGNHKTLMFSEVDYPESECALFGVIDMAYKLLPDSHLPPFYKKVITDIIQESGLILSTTDSNSLPPFIGYQTGDINQNSLLNYFVPSIQIMPEIALLSFGTEDPQDEHSIPSLEQVSTKELIVRISNSSIVYLNVDELDFDDCLLSHFPQKSSLKIVILTGTNQDNKMQILTEMFVRATSAVVLQVDRPMKQQILDMISNEIYVKLDVEKLRIKCDGKLFTANGYQNMKEIYGLSNAVRFVLFSTCKNTPLRTNHLPEKLQIAISRRIENIFLNSSGDLPSVDVQNLEKLARDRFPYLEVERFFAKNPKLSELIFADFLTPFEDKKETINADELLHSMKSFENKKKWRRARKTSVAARGYASDGEQFVTFSDKDLTDTESVSGAKIIGIDQDIL